MRPSQRAWIALGVGILVWDILAPPEETLSEQCYRWRESHPVLADTLLELVYRHLGQQPLPVDPIHLMFVASQWARARVTAGIPARWSRKHFGATRRG